MKTILDLMEYSSDSEIQLKYVTNASVVNISNADIDNEDMADITDWTDDDYSGGASTQVTFDSKSCMKLDSGSIGNEAARFKTLGILGTVFSFNLYFDVIGTKAGADGLRIMMGNGTYLFYANFCSDGLFIADSSSVYQEVGTDLVVQDIWQEWTFNFNWVAGTVNVYLNQVLKASGVNFAQSSVGYNKVIRINQQGDTTANRISYVDWEKTGSNFYIPLQSYSGSTIKTQGSYSLKGIAAITDSLNKTLTKTVSPTIDLSGLSKIKFDIRASRTGSNIKIGLHDSGGTTTEITPNILSADTWQEVIIPLQNVVNANKDAIDSIIITILNADAANTFYIDNCFSTFTSPVIMIG